MAKFHELRDKRLPAAVHKIELIGNLGRPSYGATHAERAQMVHTLAKALAETAKRCKVPVELPRPAQEPGKTSKIPAGTADGGASFEAEIRWAIDAIQRGDSKLAVSRLKRCLKET